MAIKLKYFKTRVVRYPVLAMVGLTALVVLGLNCELSKADWGTWVGSVGTVGTLIGTILLATSETRRRNKEAFSKARIKASEMHPAQVHNESNIGTAILCLELGARNAVQLQAEASYIHDIADSANTYLAKFNMCSLDDLLILAPLPDDCAAELAAAQGRINSSKVLLEGLRQVSSPNEALAQLILNRDILMGAAQKVAKTRKLFERVAVSDW